MANTKYDTGHGASMTFGTSSYSFNWTKISLSGTSREPVDITKLATTGQMEKMAGDLEEPGTATIDFQWDQAAAVPATSTAAETVTVTFPAPAGHATPPTYAGTGLITAVKLPDLGTGELQMGQLTVQWDGGTGPAYTPSST